MMSDDEKKTTVADVKKNWTGTENADGVTVSLMIPQKKQSSSIQSNQEGEMSSS